MAPLGSAPHCGLLGAGKALPFVRRHWAAVVEVCLSRAFCKLKCLKRLVSYLACATNLKVKCFDRKRAQRRPEVNQTTTGKVLASLGKRQAVACAQGRATANEWRSCFRAIKAPQRLKTKMPRMVAPKNLPINAFKRKLATQTSTGLKAVPPNHSLNRTFCGVPCLG